MIVPILVLGLLGLGFAVMLFFASKRFAVKVDPRIEEILKVLPGANCGACGFPGCAGLAEAIAEGRAEPGGCPAGGIEVAKKVGAIMGREVETKVELVAFVRCRVGRKKAKKKFKYEGVNNCQAANILFEGDTLCSYGCLGLGSCVEACLFDAIHIDEQGIAVVDPEKCKSCGKCVTACPKNLIVLVPKTQQVLVACANEKRGKEAKEVCEIACIGCRICEKQCPQKAITIVNNLPVIDFEKCDQCGICVEKCPTKAISKNERTFLRPGISGEEP